MLELPVAMASAHDPAPRYRWFLCGKPGQSDRHPSGRRDRKQRQLHGSLEQLVAERGGKLDVSEAMQYASKVGEALEVVHRAGVLHRDIKPLNVMVADARVVLIDSGSAREYTAGVAQSHTLLLSPGFALFEQYARNARRGPSSHDRLPDPRAHGRVHLCSHGRCCRSALGTV